MGAQTLTASILVLALSYLPVPYVHNQSKEQVPTEPSTVLKATTRLVVVDVVATDDKGEPIPWLTAKDFKVIEDGREQELRVFEFQHPSQSPGTAVAGGAKLPANVFSNIPTYKPGSAMNVILLDVLNTAVPRQTFVRDELLHFLEKQPLAGPTAIYILGGGLHLVQDFTDDSQALRAAADRLHSKGSALMDNPAAGPEMKVPLAGGMPPQLQAAARAHEQEAKDFNTGEQVQITLAALASLAQRLAPYPGRKNVIWISDAFPFYINPRSASQSIAGNTYRQEASKADAVLMDSQVAIYPIDAHAEQVASLDDIGFGRVYGIQIMHGEPLQLASKDMGERLAVRSTMNELAEETGGQAFYNTNSIDLALRKSMDDGSTYYTLGYYPQDKHWDGKFRKIEVKVGQSGVKLRYRLGYYALEPSVARVKDGMWDASLHSALDPNSPASSGLLFRAAVLGPSEKTGNKVMVNFGIDPHTISFNRESDGLQHAALECAVEAYSQEGKLIKSEATTVNAALPPDAFAAVSKSYFPCRQTIDLPAGSYWLRLGVVDNRTGFIGVTNATATVQAQK